MIRYVAYTCGLILIQVAMADETAAPLLEQRMQSFTIELDGSVTDVTPFFGPIREAEWAPGWSPRFIHPAIAAQREGVVFTTTGDHGRERLWMLTAYDVYNGRVEYVVMSPAFTVSEIKIRVAPDGKQRCKATIMYRRSALSPEGNDEVVKLDSHWSEEQRIHWEAAIDEALAKERIHD